MQDNFCLSDKILSEIYGEYNEITKDTDFNPEDSLKVKDVREFIKRLKDRFNDAHPEDERALMFHQSLIIGEINELAGSKLVGDK